MAEETNTPAASEEGHAAKITLTTKTGTDFTFDVDTISQSEYVKDLITANGIEAFAEEKITLDSIDDEQMEKVKKWLDFFAKKEMDELADTFEAKDFKDRYFNVNNNRDEIIKTTLAAHSLSIPSLVDHAVTVIARSVAGKTTQQIRDFWNIVNDFTPEEERKVREEFYWVEDTD